MIVRPSGETSTDIHVPSSTVKRTIRDGLSGSRYVGSVVGGTTVSRATGPCAMAQTADMQSVTVASVDERKRDMEVGAEGGRAYVMRWEDGLCLTCPPRVRTRRRAKRAGWSLP